MKNVKIWGAVLVGLALVGWGVCLLDRTLVEWWRPVAWAAGGAIVAGAVGGRRRLMVMTVTAVVLFWGLLALNYYESDLASEHTERVTVLCKYSKERHRTRRVRNRVVSTGEKYYVYYLSMQFADGRIKDRQVPLSRYNRVRQGSELELTMARGLLDWPVIKD